MLIFYVFLLLLLSIKSRIYDTMNEIYFNLSKSIHKIPLQFVINGTNGFSYNFTSKDIVFLFYQFIKNYILIIFFIILKKLI